MASPRDSNQVVVAQGSYNGTATSLMIENATGYLKATIYNRSFGTPVVVRTTSAHDDNSVASDSGSYNSTVKPLLVTNDEGFLRAIIS